MSISHLVHTLNAYAPAILLSLAAVGFTPTRTALQGVVPWLAEWAGYGALNSFGVKVFRDRQAVPAKAEAKSKRVMLKDHFIPPP